MLILFLLNDMLVWSSILKSLQFRGFQLYSPLLRCTVAVGPSCIYLGLLICPRAPKVLGEKKHSVMIFVTDKICS